VARGTQHRKRRPTSNAVVTPKAGAKPKPVKQDSWEDQLFFPRLRRHAKWVFVLLALVFAFSFVLFGVGSGSTGISDALGNFGNLFGGSSGSSSSTSKLEKRTREHPQDAQAWRELATALQTQEGKTDEAIAALTRFTELKPKNQDALEELGALYLRRAEDYRQQYLEADLTAKSLQPASQYAPSSGSPLASALQDPIASGISTSTGADTSEASTKFAEVEGKAVDVYKKLAALNPEDAQNQFRLGQVAEAAGKNADAIAGYQAFLKLAPNDSLATVAKQRLKQLTAPATASTSAG
jgi:Flp pilus assembly protein TadD